jgi:hypothetical protein
VCNARRKCSLCCCRRHPPPWAQPPTSSQICSISSAVFSLSCSTCMIWGRGRAAAGPQACERAAQGGGTHCCLWAVGRRLCLPAGLLPPGIAVGGLRSAARHPSNKRRARRRPTSSSFVGDVMVKPLMARAACQSAPALADLGGLLVVLLLLLLLLLLHTPQLPPGALQGPAEGAAEPRAAVARRRSAAATCGCRAWCSCCSSAPVGCMVVRLVVPAGAAGGRRRGAMLGAPTASCPLSDACTWDPHRSASQVHGSQVDVRPVSVRRGSA